METTPSGVHAPSLDAVPVLELTQLCAYVAHLRSRPVGHRSAPARVTLLLLERHLARAQRDPESARIPLAPQVVEALLRVRAEVEGYLETPGAA